MSQPSPDFEYYDVIPTRKRNPWVVAGALATAGVLVSGLIAFKQGNMKLSNTMMRWRVIAQGGTVAIMMGSWAAFDNTLKFQATLQAMLMEERKAQESQSPSEH